MKETDVLINELEKYRKSHGLKIEEMSKKIDISKSAYYNWLNGAAPRMHETLLKIEDFLEQNKSDVKLHHLPRNKKYVTIDESYGYYLENVRKKDPKLAGEIATSILEALFTGVISYNDERISAALTELKIPFRVATAEDYEESDNDE